VAHGALSYRIITTLRRFSRFAAVLATSGLWDHERVPWMDERALLDALLDAFDRLFDRQTTVVDVHALLFATARSLRGSAFVADVDAAEVSLKAIVKSGITPEDAVERALEAVDPLRRRIAAQL
jgi:hypothetical protein